MRTAKFILSLVVGLCACTNGEEPLRPEIAFSEEVAFTLVSSPSFTTEWVSRASMPSPARAAAAAAFSGRIYILGGEGNAVGNQIYDPVANAWLTGAEFAGARDHAMAAALSDGVHLLGGASSFPADHQVYAPGTNSWSPRAPLPTATWAAAAAALNGKIYIIGGRDIANNGAISDVQIYDAATNSWVRGTDMPTARMKSAVGIIDGKIYVAGGEEDNFGTSDRLERYDPASDTWVSLARVPAQRDAMGGGVIEGRFCVFGGRLVDPDPTGDAFPNTYCFDPVSNSWGHEPDMITARVEMGSVQLNNRVYAIAGRAPTPIAGVVEVLQVFNRTPTAGVNGPYSGNEGQTINFSSAGSSDPEGGTLTYTWTFGDGTSSTAANPNKRYGDNGTYKVKLTVTDPHGLKHSDSTTATIANVAPTGKFTVATMRLASSVREAADAEAAGEEVEGSSEGEMEEVAATRTPSKKMAEGTPYTLKLAGTDAGTKDRLGLQYALDCGQGAGFSAWSNTNTLDCPTLPDQRPAFPVLAKVRDKDGAEAWYTINLKINNALPVVQISAGSATTFAIGGVFSASGSFADKGVNDAIWTYTINWGDGTAATTGSTSTQNTAIPASHTYAKAGTFYVQMSIKDKDGGGGRSSLITITVNP